LRPPPSPLCASVVNTKVPGPTPHQMNRDLVCGGFRVPDDRIPMMRRLSAFLTIVLSLSCTRETPQPPPVATTSSAESSHEGGRLVRRLEGNVKTLNYLLQQTEDERQVLALLYDPLIDLDQNLTPIPGVAARWYVLDGGKTYVL